MLRSLAIQICCTLLLFAYASSVLAAKNYQELAEKSVGPYLARYPRAAVTVGIVDANGTHVFGFGQLKQKDPESRPDGKTIYQIGSITKTFTCTLLAEQVVLGHLKLEDPAQDYLPAELVLPREKDRQITLADLATHRSGLPRLPQLANFFMLGGAIVQNPYAGNTWGDMPGVMRTVWLSSPIGTEYGYSNLAMGLLGQALVNETDSASYAELVSQRITKPLGMADTCVELTTDQTPRLAQGYNLLRQMTPAWDFASLEGAGALYSTVDDMLVYAAANLGLKNTDLQPAMQLAQQPQPGRNWPGGLMGLGWHINESEGDTRPDRVWHNGMTGGYASMLILVPDKRLGVVVLSNVAAGVDHVAGKIVEELSETPWPTIEGESD